MSSLSNCFVLWCCIFSFISPPIRVTQVWLDEMAQLDLLDQKDLLEMLVQQGQLANRDHQDQEGREEQREQLETEDLMVVLEVEAHQVRCKLFAIYLWM